MSASGVTAYIGLGSNLGDRAGALRAATEALGALPSSRLGRVSAVRETAPVRVPGGARDPGGPYLNSVAEIQTGLAPRQLLDALQAIERRGGRDRGRSPHGGPRPIDLDLLLHGDALVDEPGLIVPHPGLTHRRFVLEPLAELAPGLVVPGTGRSVLDHLAALTPAAETPP